MLNRGLRLVGYPVLGAIVFGAVITVPAGLVGSGVLAQTLTDPNPSVKWTPPASTKSRPAAETSKRCSAFGPGFVNVPGTDTCVKVGGWVTIEGGTSR